MVPADAAFFFFGTMKTVDSNITLLNTSADLSIAADRVLPFMTITLYFSHSQLQLVHLHVTKLTSYLKDLLKHK